jgi:sugar phosphate isomerase/epimerase
MADAITETGYKGWIVLETSSPSKNGVADAKRNADYVRSLFSR